MSAGAVAWAAHAFVALAMPAWHPFWSAPEAPLPADGEASGQLAAAGAGLLASWSGVTGETRLHNARSGHPPDIVDHDYAASYGKLAYRSAFPFDLPIDLATSAGDDGAVVAIDSNADGPAGSGRSPTGTSRTPAARDPAGSWPATGCRRRRDRPSCRRWSWSSVMRRSDQRRPAGRPDPPSGRRRSDGVDLDDRIEMTADDRTGLLSLVAGDRTVAIRPLAGYDRTGWADTTASRVNLVHDRARHPYVEEAAASSRRRIVAAAILAVAAAVDAAVALDGIRLERATEDEAEIAWSRGVAAVSFARRAPATGVVGGWTVRGPALRVVRVALDGSSLAGETISSVDGLLELDRPGMVAVGRIDGGVEATLEAGIRLDPGWAGGGLVRLSARHGAGPFEPLPSLSEPGAVPGAVVRRLARRAGTRLVTIRIERDR